MVYRRKNNRRRKTPKVFSISAVETGVALSLLQSTGAASAVQMGLQGNIAGGLKLIETNVLANKIKIIGVLAAGTIAKMLTRGFSTGRLAKLGPIAVRV